MHVFNGKSRFPPTFKLTRTPQLDPNQQTNASNLITIHNIDSHNVGYNNIVNNNTSNNNTSNNNTGNNSTNINLTDRKNSNAYNNNSASNDKVTSSDNNSMLSNNTRQNNNIELNNGRQVTTLNYNHLNYNRLEFNDNDQDVASEIVSDNIINNNMRSINNDSDVDKFNEDILIDDNLMKGEKVTQLLSLNIKLINKINEDLQIGIFDYKNFLYFQQIICSLASQHNCNTKASVHRIKNYPVLLNDRILICRSSESSDGNTNNNNNTNDNNNNNTNDNGNINNNTNDNNNTNSANNNTNNNSFNISKTFNSRFFRNLEHKRKIRPINRAVKVRSISVNIADQLYQLVSDLISSIEERQSPILELNTLVTITNHVRGDNPEIILSEFPTNNSIEGIFILPFKGQQIEIPLYNLRTTEVTYLSNCKSNLTRFNLEQLREIAIYLEQFLSLNSNYQHSCLKLFDQLRLDIANRRAKLYLDSKKCPNNK